MDSFVFQNPTKIIFGRNTISKIGKETSIYGKKALLVYGMGSIKRNGVYDKVVESLKKYGIDFVEHSWVKPNPVLSHVKDGICKFKDNNCDVIVACGGGSVIDEAKAIAAGVRYNGDVWDFFIKKAKIESAAPLLTVVTLASTGSQANGGAVITNEKTLHKYSAHSYHLFPKVSILDPTTVSSLPKEQIVYGAVDAILHVLEGFFTTRDCDSVVTDNYVFAVVNSIINSTQRLLKDINDYNAGASFMWASTLALNGMEDLGYKETEFINHVIEHSLSAIYDIPHGLGLAIVFCGFLKYLIEKGELRRICEFGEKVFGFQNDGEKETATKIVKTLEDWFRGMGIKTTLSENNIPPTEISKIVENSLGLAALWGASYNASDIRRILEYQK